MDVSEKLNTTLTDYQVLVQMLQAFFKNLSEVMQNFYHTIKLYTTHIKKSLF